MTTNLRKAGSNWVDGERFFDRELEIEILRERIGEGTHTLITAQRRMGKTSLVRELLRRLEEEGHYATVFVDLEAASDAADAVAEIAIQSRSLDNVWDRAISFVGNTLRSATERIDELELSELKIKLRASIDAGSWQLRGDHVFAALASNDRPVVLAIDELPILVNRMVNGRDFKITAKRRDAADQFMSWLRRNGQAHRDNVTLILSGSIGLQPILNQANLSAQANIYSPFELPPWSEETAVECLGALARHYDLEISRDVRIAMCNSLRCCVPHHVQQFFDHLHNHLRSERRDQASIEDAKFVFENHLLGIRGHIELRRYEERLNSVLGPELHTFALDILTEAAGNDGYLPSNIADRHRDAIATAIDSGHDHFVKIMFVLEHDGYLEPHGDGHRFVSKLLQYWWSARYLQHFTPIENR